MLSTRSSERNHNYDGFEPSKTKTRRGSLVLRDENAEIRRENLKRRGSHDEKVSRSRQFLVSIDTTIEQLLASEDTDGDMQITIEDSGPKVFTLQTTTSNGINSFDIRGTYQLSNLLQELLLAKESGLKQILLDQDRLNEPPVDRLDRYIQEFFWKRLTRRLDKQGILELGRDQRDWTVDGKIRIYVPQGCPEQFDFYRRLGEEDGELELEVLWLPGDWDDPDVIRKLNSKPGLLALATEKTTNPITGQPHLVNVPFLSPGGQSRELAGWSWYMMSLGLLVHNQVHLVKSMVTNLCFSIQHYGKVLPANRSYYLDCSQPPFLTDMALLVYDRIRSEPGALEFLRVAILAAIKEYYQVWMGSDRLDLSTGLSRYRPRKKRLSPEMDVADLLPILRRFADGRGMGIKEYVKAYNGQEISEPDLDKYLLHKRATLESGHDGSFRLEGKAADLVTVDLNCLLYKYEVDIAHAIQSHFNDNLPVTAGFAAAASSMKVGEVHTSAVWTRRAKLRKARVDRYLWNENKKMYFDYNTTTNTQATYESATTLYPLWAGLCHPHQAALLTSAALPALECRGGLVAGTADSVPLPEKRREWDYPLGWAPHQLMAWIGLARYGYVEEVERLAYKWLWTVTKVFVDYNGVVAEKYDVTNGIDPQHAGEGILSRNEDFKGIPKEGFGWTNASYVYGLQILDGHMKRALKTLTPYETYMKSVDMGCLEEDYV